MISRSGDYEAKGPSGPYRSRSKADFHGFKGHLDYSPADVLYLLDCPHASIKIKGPRKELIGACASDPTKELPESENIFKSLSSTIAEDLTDAAASGITVAQLWANCLVRKQNGELGQTPVQLSDEERNEDPMTLLREWLTTSDVEDAELSFEYSAPMAWGGSIVISTMPSRAYQCMPSHEATRFMSFFTDKGS